MYTNTIPFYIRLEHLWIWRLLEPIPCGYQWMTVFVCIYVYVFIHSFMHRCMKAHVIFFYLFIFRITFLNFIYFFIQQVLISHQFYTHQCIHLNPNRPILHTTIPMPPQLSPLGVHTFVLCICVSTSALQTSSSVPFF